MTNLVLVDQSVMFGKYCSVPAQEIDVCPNTGWTRDFADPQTILDPLFAGYNIVSTGNTNIGQVDVPEINAGCRRRGNSSRTRWSNRTTYAGSTICGMPATGITPIRR
jgi:hypothetical protein